MSIKSCILLLGLVVYLSDQVSSLKCYECDSYSDGKCYNNPKQPQFERTCDIGGIEFFNAVQPGLVSILDVLLSNATLARNHKKINKEHDCGTLKISFLGSTVAIRRCLPSIVTCKNLESVFDDFGMVLEQCSRCSKNLCNSRKLR